MAVLNEAQQVTPAEPRGSYWQSEAHMRRVRRRHAADRRMRAYGIAAIALAVGLLAVLVSSLVITGAQGFLQTDLRLEVEIDPAEINAEDPSRGDYRQLLLNALDRLLPGERSRAEQRELRDLLSNGAQFQLRDRVVADPELIGQSL
jgi:phosphate transport system permease protein